MDRAAAVVAVLLVGLVALSLPAALKAQAAAVEVLDYQCNKHGAVTALQLAAVAPGVVNMRWDNAVVCGKPT